jgi:glutamine synthetase
MFGYSALRESTHAEFLHQILDSLREYDVELEGLHTETGPGVYEAAIRYAPILKAADKAALFKTAVKEIAARNGLLVTFMAKWNASLPGSSGHIHQSLWDAKGNRNLFHDGKDPRGMSELMRHYIGGQLALMPEMMAMICPTVNSYKRTVPGTWAAVNASWGIENRTTSLRAIPSGSKSCRVEYRLAGADGNPYLTMAAALASGLHGVQNRMEPQAATVGSAYDAALPALPRSWRSPRRR